MLLLVIFDRIPKSEFAFNLSTFSMNLTILGGRSFRSTETTDVDLFFVTKGTNFDPFIFCVFLRTILGSSFVIYFMQE